MTRKIILYALAIVLVVVAYFAMQGIAASKNQVRPKPKKIVKTVFVDTVKNSIVPITIPTNGNLVAKRRVELFAEVQGVFKYSSHPFKQGQQFRRGQTLISIDASEYYATVQSSKSNLYNQITAIMPDLRLDFPEVYPKWQAYLDNFDINKTTPSLPEFTTDKERYFINGRGITTTYYNVKNLEQRLGKYRIVAPFSGVLTEALVTEGTLIRAGQKLGEFINTSTYELEVAISKNYSDLLKIGETVQLQNLEGTSMYQGTVSRINGRIDQETQTVKVFIEVNDESLKEGMYLEANLEAKKEENAIAINRNLIQNGNEIFVVNDSILNTITVNPVYFSSDKVVVKGVPDGEVILSKPTPGAYAGMLVKVYEEKPDTSNTTNTEN